MFSPSRTILMVSDEVLYIYASGYKGVRLVETIPWDAENFVENVSKIISKDCGSKPLVIVNDMVEQHYRKERVPKVGVMDKSSVVKRKLNIAFPNYPVRAALPLKERVARTSKTAASYVYIFAAVPSSPSFHQTMEASKKSLAPIVGFCLLPIEAADMVKTLSMKLTPRGQAKARWAVLIGQHQNGGLRQIVIKNGELALTRMTPIADSEIDVEEWANDVNQEFKATMSYMARFGFSSEDGLDVIVVANDDCQAALENVMSVDGDLHLLQLSDAAKKLGIPLSGLEDQKFADPLHVGWIAKKNRLTLAMHAKEVEDISRPRKIANAASILLFLSAGFFTYQLGNDYSKFSEINDEIDSQRSQKAQLDVQYQKEVEKKKALGFDVELVQRSIAIHDALEQQDIKVLKLLQEIGKSLGPNLRADTITISRSQGENAVDGIAALFQGRFDRVFKKDGDEAAAHVYRVSLQLSYPSTTDIDKGNSEVQQLRDRLQRNLPRHDVNVEKFLKDTEYVDELVLDDEGSNKKDTQEYVVSISIEGANI